jgi:hypothetical protein
MRDLLGAANRRYLAFLSNLTDPSAGVQQVERLAEPRRHDERSYRGFNLFSADDLALFTALARGEWQISGFRNASLRRVLPPLLRSAAGLAPAQTLARAWPDQEDRAHRQVPPDARRPTGRLDRLDATRARRDSLSGGVALSRCLTFCASCDQLHL